MSYESACIGVAKANGVRRAALVDEYRSLGAPVLLEVDGDSVGEWIVGRSKESHHLVEIYSGDRVNQLFVERAHDWKPAELLRAKNIGNFQWVKQGGLFDGVLPELEERIQKSLDPLLKQALSSTKEAFRISTGREPDPSALFKLVFTVLTAKVFHDRQLGPFSNLGPDADQLLAAVAKHYGTDVQKPLNRVAREVAAKSVWSELDFRNLSVEVLSQIWSETLVDDTTKKLLGIHRTSRTIVRYILDRIPFERTDDERIILEPCCGSAVFLIGAMNHLRPNLFGMPADERHQYFIKHLVGIEKDPFGVEISRLALTLADFPCPNGWNVKQADVFTSPDVPAYLQRSGVVLCNPPFEKFGNHERRSGQVSVNKPVELLERVLRDLHPRGVLGFVLPLNIVDGRGYAAIRRKLAERFASLDFTHLPDRAFEADHEVALMIATDPIPHERTSVAVREVPKQSWKDFEVSHATGEERRILKTPLEAKKDLAVPELAEVWEALKDFRTLSECASVHRGIEWNKALTEKRRETGFRRFVVSNSAANGFALGVAPQAKNKVFESPTVCFLNMEQRYRRGNAHSRPWSEQKVVVNKTRRARTAWKTSAFPDDRGLVCYQTFFGVWPKEKCPNIWTLSAILNSPLANAFIAAHEKRQDITGETLKKIPMPYFTEADVSRIESLVKRYRDLVSRGISKFAVARNVLMEIDAAVLAAYHLSPRLETQILERFTGAQRQTPFDFGQYLPDGEDVCFSLSDRIAPSFKESTASALLRRMASG